MFYTYILKSNKTNSYYIGSTSNIKNRIKLHNSAKVRSTKSYLPWRLIAYKSFQERRMAIKFELELKRLKSRQGLEKTIKHF